MQNVGKGLASVVERAPGLKVIVVSGGDGIPLLKYPETGPSEGAGPSGALESAFAIATDQVTFSCFSGSCREVPARTHQA